MLSKSGFECHIEVDDGACEEYDLSLAHELRPPTIDNAKEVCAAYIRLDAEKEFGIAYHIGGAFDFKPGNAVSMAIRLNGNLVDSSILDTVDVGNHGVLRGLSYSRNGQWYMRPFVVNKLSSIEEFRESSNLLSRLNQLGKIDVHVRKVSASSAPADGNSTPYDQSHEQNTTLVPEKGLKGRDLQVSAGVSAIEKACNACTMMNAKDAEDDPLVHFSFHYRSHEALQRIGVLKTIDEKDPDELSPEELRELVRKQRRQIEEDREDLLHLKRNAATGRKERPTRVHSKTPDESEVVDLT